MSTIPKPKKKRFYKRWWFWTLIVLAIVLIVATAGGASSYEDARIASYDYLKEEVTVETRDMKKTVSTNGTIASQGIQEVTIPAELEGLDATAVLGELGVSEEQVQEEVDKLLELAEDATQVDFYASDSEVLVLEVGQTATVTIPAYDDGKEEFAGEVVAVRTVKETGNAAAALTGGSTEDGYRISLAVTDLPEEVREFTGLAVDVVVEIEEKQDVLTVQPGAVQYDDNDEPFVYLLPTIDEEFVEKAEAVEDVADVLEKKYIDVGFEGDQYIEVTDGLREGDSVLLYVPTQGSDSPFGF